MARDGGEIQIRIGADASELNAESAKAAKSLAGIGGQATKTGKQIDKSSDAMKGSARRMGELTEGTQNTTDEFGELSSGAAALAAALDVVDPRLGAAARGLGDLAGSAEGALRLTKLSGGALSVILNPAVLAVTAAVGLAAGAWALFTKKLKAANEKMEQSEERLNATMERVKSLKDATMELAVAEGRMTEIDAARQKAMRAVNDEYRDLLTTRTNLVQTTKSELDAAKFGRKAKHEAYLAAQDSLAALHKEIAAKKTVTLALIELGEAEKEKNKETGKGTKGVEDSTKALLAHTAALAAAQMGARQMRDALAAEGDQFKELELQRKAAVGTRGDLFKQELAALEQLAEAGEDTAERQVIAHENFANDRDAINQSYTAKATALREEEADQLASMRRDEYRAHEAAQQQRLAHIDEEEAKRIAAAWEVFDRSMEMANTLQGALTAFAELRLQQAMNIEGQMTQAQKTEARRRWKVNQGMAIAEATLHMAAGMARVHKDYPYPASLAAKALVALAAGVSVAAVVASPAPSFKQGGIVPGSGAQPIIAHGGEGVLTESATQSIGGQAGVDAINSGSITAKLDTLIQAVQEQKVTLKLGHREFDQFIHDDLRRPGSRLKTAIRGAALTRGLVI